jgi:predicted CXXCH cytochrome family protein
MNAPTLPGALIRVLAVVIALGVGAGLRADATDQDCLKCYADRHLQVVREGRAVPLYTDAAILAASVHSSLGCADCHDGVDATARPSHAPAAAVDCRACHQGVAKTHAFHADFARGAVTTKETDCVACHGSHTMGPASGAGSAFSGAALTQSCARCHAGAATAFLASAHGSPMAAARAESPTCLTCHRHPVAAGGDKLALKQEQVRLCVSCHRDQSSVLADSSVSRGFISSYERSVHEVALAQGNAKAANCVDCHGSHETAGALSSSSRVNPRNLPGTCARCHAKEAAEYGLSAHGGALRKGLPDAPVCTTCHGEHQILKHGDPRSPVSVRNVSEMVCGTCHASVKLSQRYGLAADRLQTFADSYHGLATRGGSVVAVNCASCHGAHAVRPSSDPLSPVNKANLARTCGQCHKGADAQFASEPVHLTASAHGQEPVVYWIATLYVWLIIVVVCGMVLHNGLDFVRKVRRKVALQKGLVSEEPVPHRLYLRMTVNERLQHGALVLSFATLVVTGFMLEFPEAWWVVHIRHLSSHVFEWRSAIHRVAGVAMILAGVWHFGYLALTARGRRLFVDLMPQPSDARDAYGILRYNLSLSGDRPRFARFSYIEKTEYWAMMWGSFVMGITGALLWFENTSIHLFTKLGYDVSRTVHFYEAVLATLAIIVWHFYFVIFNPDVYPMNLSWLTGSLSEREMREDHPRELERLERERAANKENTEPKGP